MTASGDSPYYKGYLAAAVAANGGAAAVCPFPRGSAERRLWYTGHTDFTYDRRADETMARTAGGRPTRPRTRPPQAG